MRSNFRFPVAAEEAIITNVCMPFTAQNRLNVDLTKLYTPHILTLNTTVKIQNAIFVKTYYVDSRTFPDGFIWDFAWNYG